MRRTALLLLLLAPAGAHAATVPGALHSALGSGAITQAQYDGWTGVYKQAAKVKHRLPANRKRELGAVLSSVKQLASGGLLVPSRMPVVFLELQRNTSFWREKPFPSGGYRRTFGNSQVIFQYYPGQGMRFMPLANWGKANTMYNACVKSDEVRPGTPCRKEAFRKLLDELLGLAAQRGGFTTWEYYMPFDGGRPPFASGLAVGTAIQALARGSALLGDPKYAQAGLSALELFKRRPPVGVAVPADGGTHYLIYSFAPRYFVINAFIQSLNGLYDFNQLTGDPTAGELFAAGEQAARVELPRYDTGAWSIYGRGSGVGDVGRESPLGYHRLLRDFLSNLCDRTKTALYCDTAKRFTKYLYEKPRLEWLGRKGSAIRFKLSKMSTLSVTARAHGKVVYSSSRLVGYGVKVVPLPGKATSVTIRAVDVRNHPQTLSHGL